MPKMTQATVDRAATIRGGFERAVEAARANTRLSSHGRQQKIAQAWTVANKQMTELRAGFEGGAAVTASDIQRQVFGATNVSGSDAISMRDAMDRASQVADPREAMTLLRQAEMTGDDHLARAVANSAWGNAQHSLTALAWAPVVEAYLEPRPTAASKLQELSAAQSNSIKDSLDLGGYTYLLKPDELGRLTPGDIDAMAAMAAEVEA